MAAAADHSLPDDDAKLARVARCDAKQWDQLRPTLAAMFTVRDGAWRHEWIEKEVAFIAAKRAKRRHAANVRWQSKTQENNESDDASASGLHMQNDATSPSPSPSPSPSLSPSPSPSAAQVDALAREPAAEEGNKTRDGKKGERLRKEL
jgi:hypothetical protein